MANLAGAERTGVVGNPLGDGAHGGRISALSVGVVGDPLDNEDQAGRPGAVTGAGGGGGGPTLSYKMRALQDPGPGYETWVVTGNPDFAGASAGGPIQAGTAV
ncbi:hypothetical protein LCGC14_2209780, partial [marine sediment metagenome]